MDVRQFGELVGGIETCYAQFGSLTPGLYVSGSDCARYAGPLARLLNRINVHRESAQIREDWDAVQELEVKLRRLTGSPPQEQ